MKNNGQLEIRRILEKGVDDLIKYGRNGCEMLLSDMASPLYLVAALRDKYF